MTTGSDFKADLHEYLRDAREALMWKLDGLGEYDIRRPLTPTGTNLLGLVKHQAGSELRYLGPVFARPHDIELPWSNADAEPNADMWATSWESRATIVDIYRRVWAVSDATIAALPIDAPGRVPWWGDEEVTLHQILVHVTAATQRHAGHADIVRELIDGSAGLLEGRTNLPDVDPAWWANYRNRVEQAARQAGA
jgi:Protein of unknown function (DUF664)